MKRRDFIRHSAAGLLLPVAAKAGLVTAAGPRMTVASSSGGGSGGATTDWTQRSTLPGVVWAHNFDSAAEVNAFRHVGGFNDPGNTGGSTIQWNASDGFDSGGCLEITVPSNGTAAGGWWRPMARLNAASTGRSTDDAGCGGTVKIRPWVPTDATENYDFRQGYYGHPTVAAANTTWQGTTDPFDGWGFFFQFRVKIEASRWQGYSGASSSATRNPFGKLIFIDTTASTHESEIVVYSGGPDPQYFHDTYPFRMYTASGSAPNSFLSSPQGAGDGATMQGGGPYNATCLIGSDTTGASACWEWPRTAEWITVLIHVIPGTDNQADATNPLSSWDNKNATLEAWVQRAADSDYTKVFENYGLAWLFGDRDGDANVYEIHPAAFNSVCPSAYMNNVPALSGFGWYQRYTQLIFSKDWIPPVGLTAGSWF